MRKIKKLPAAEAVKIDNIRTKVRAAEIRRARLHEKQEAAYLAAVDTTEFGKLHRLLDENKVSHVILVKDGILYYEVCRCDTCLSTLHALGLSELAADESCVLEAPECNGETEEDDDEDGDEDTGDGEDDVCISSEPVQHVTQDLRVQMGFELARMVQLGELSENDVKRVMVQPDIGIC